MRSRYRLPPGPALKMNEVSCSPAFVTNDDCPWSPSAAEESSHLVKWFAPGAGPDPDPWAAKAAAAHRVHMGPCGELQQLALVTNAGSRNVTAWLMSNMVVSW